MKTFFNSKLNTKILNFLVLLFICFTGQGLVLAQSNDRVDGSVTIPTATAFVCTLSGQTIFTGTLTGTDNTQVGRLNRNGVSSNCLVPKVCDIFAIDPGRFFDEHTFTNPDAVNPLCVNVELIGLCTEGNIQVGIYLGPFDPLNICTNYLADPGFSSGIPQNPVNLSVEIPAGATITVVVFNTNPGGTCQTGGGYEVTLCYDFVSTIIPTMGGWGLIILALLLLSFGAVSVMRRQVVLAGVGAEVSSQGRGIPFKRPVFGKMLVFAMLGLAATFSVAVALFGYEMTAADVPGSLVAVPILAYLLHLLLPGKSKG